jgi:hypothetical protein
MATIIFYEKPGCATNARQRQLLEAAGHRVIRRNLLTEPWTAQRLRDFFGVAPVTEWFNRAAPRIKSGEIDTQRLSKQRALSLMLADPLLIKRPLLEIANVHIAGFDPQRLQAGMELARPEDAQDLQGCSRIPATGPDPAPQVN